MKNIILFIAFCFCQNISSGQIIISNNYFPVEGDSLVTVSATAQTVKNIQISKATTTAQNWDFSFLRARTPTTRIIEPFRALNPVSDTAILREFPTATTVTTDTSGQISVYRRSTTRFELLGFFNANMGILPLPLRPKFDPPSLERRAPLLFSTTNINKTGFNIPFSTDIIPDTLLSFLLIRPDSMRIRFVTNRQDRVDAFGKIRIPGSGELDCLRERRYEISETRIDAKTNGIPFWIDITSFLPTTAFNSRDTTLVFQFWSNLYKEPLLTIRADNDSTAISAEYKWLPINTPTIESNNAISAILFPIPAKNAVFLHLDGLISENYLLNVVDNLGKVIFSEKIKNSSDNKIQMKIDTHQWASGIYFLSLHTEGGAAVLQKKIIIE